MKELVYSFLFQTARRLRLTVNHAEAAWQYVAIMITKQQSVTEEVQSWKCLKVIALAALRLVQKIDYAKVMPLKEYCRCLEDREIRGQIPKHPQDLQHNINAIQTLMHRQIIVCEQNILHSLRWKMCLPVLTQHCKEISERWDEFTENNLDAHIGFKSDRQSSGILLKCLRYMQINLPSILQKTEQYCSKLQRISASILYLCIKQLKQRQISTSQFVYRLPVDLIFEQFLRNVLQLSWQSIHKELVQVTSILNRMECEREKSMYDMQKQPIHTQTPIGLEVGQVKLEKQNKRTRKNRSVEVSQNNETTNEKKTNQKKFKRKDIRSGQIKHLKLKQTQLFAYLLKVKPNETGKNNHKGKNKQNKDTKDNNKDNKKIIEGSTLYQVNKQSKPKLSNQPLQSTSVKEFNHNKMKAKILEIIRQPQQGTKGNEIDTLPCSRFQTNKSQITQSRGSSFSSKTLRSKQISTTKSKLTKAEPPTENKSRLAPQSSRLKVRC